MNTNRMLLSENVIRQVTFFGHVMRKGEFESLKPGDDRLRRRKESLGTEKGDLHDVHEQDEWKDANRTDPQGKGIKISLDLLTCMIELDFLCWIYLIFIFEFYILRILDLSGKKST